MIEALHIKDRKDMPVEWWHKVKRLQRRKVFRFKPGINILWGPNGSGKTTILRAIARMTHCEQGGRSVITQSSLRAMWHHKSSWRDRKKEGSGQTKKATPQGAKLDFDGQMVFYFDPTRATGLVMGAFDDDFFQEGVVNLKFNGSSGQTTMMRFAQLLGKRPSQGAAIPSKVDPNHVNSSWAEVLQECVDHLQPSIEVGKLTVLMDEPDTHLDWPTKSQFWNNIPVFAKQVQLIIATHSIYALKLQDVHWIELQRGYQKECLTLLQNDGLIQ